MHDDYKVMQIDVSEMLLVRKFLLVGVEKIPQNCCFKGCFNETVEVFLKIIFNYSLEKKKSQFMRIPGAGWCCIQGQDYTSKAA